MRRATSVCTASSSPVTLGIAHQRGQVVGDAVAIDRPHDRQLGRRQALHPRRIGRVRQVGPPLPLTPTSDAANVCTSQPRCFQRALA